MIHKVRYHTLLAILLLTLATNTRSVAQDALPQFAVFSLLSGTDVHYSLAYDINEYGYLCGEASDSGDPLNYNAFAWDGARPWRLQSPKSMPDFWLSSGRAINSDGLIAGFVANAQGLRRACVWHKGLPFVLPSRDGQPGAAFGINKHGVVAGWVRSSATDHSQLACVWIHDKLVTLEDRGYSMAVDVNSSGEVVGTRDGLATVWRDGSSISLGTLGGPSSDASAINNDGTIVGSSTIQHGDTVRHAFRWSDGDMSDLHFPSASSRNIGSDSYATAIGPNGAIIGWATSRSGRERVPWVRLNNELVELAQLCPPDTFTRPVTPYGINGHGQIVGSGAQRDRLAFSCTFVASPINPSLTISPPYPGTSGTVNTIHVTNGVPGAQVQLYAGECGGGTRINGCELSENALGIHQARRIGTATLDDIGTADIVFLVPEGFENRSFVFQTCVESDCAVSNWLKHRFGPD